jgi:hypothetical protein
MTTQAIDLALDALMVIFSFIAVCVGLIILYALMGLITTAIVAIALATIAVLTFTPVKAA